MSCGHQLVTKDPAIICTILKVLQTLILSGDMIGEALVAGPQERLFVGI